MNITIVGTGYVGLVTGAFFSDLGHEVLCVDVNEDKIAKLKQLIMPIYEVGLEDLVKRNVDAGRLSFSTSMEEGVNYAEVIFVCVGTPPGYKGEAQYDLRRAGGSRCRSAHAKATSLSLKKVRYR